MNSSAIRIVSPAEFDQGTAQTPGSERSAAIAPDTWHRVGDLGRPVRGGAGIADRNSSSRRAGNDRLRALRSLRNPLGHKRRIGCACRGRRFHSCSRLSATYGNQSFKTRTVSVGRRAQYSDTHRGQSSGRHLAVSRCRLREAGRQKAVSRMPSCKSCSGTLRTWSNHGRPPT